ncbi:hypothetical protein DV738_g1357, partial [Chaetothyriales sp. CBS 135597]
MKFTSIVMGLGAVWLANALTITNPSSNVTQVPVWPETLLEWTWAVGDPETVDIVIQYIYPNDTEVHALTWKKNVSATGGNITVPWTPLGLSAGTVCEIGLTQVDDGNTTYDHTESFTLVQAVGAASTASSIPPLVTSSSTTPLFTSSSITPLFTSSSITPLVTGISVRPIGSNVSATLFTTISSTSTVTVITDTGISTATMTSVNTINTSVSSKFAATTTTPASSQPVSPVGFDQVTTVHMTISTITRTISLTKALSAPILDTASALASSAITAPVSAGPQSAGGVQGASTVLITVTETGGACGSGAANSMHVMAKSTTPTTGAYLTVLTLLVWFVSGVVIGGGLAI